MRTKFLSVIAAFIITSITVTSCLGSDTEYDYSSDNTIRAFALDTIYYGINYKFTIDNINNKIYNVDSVPYSADTIINKILIKTFTTAVNNSGYFVVSVDDNAANDTLFNYSNDSIDLSNTMAEPLRVRVYPQDGSASRVYSIEVRIHQQDPDTIEWNLMDNSFSNGVVNNKTKTVILNNTLYTFTSNNTVYSSHISNGKSFTESNLIGFPAGDNIKLYSIINHKDILYAVTDGGNVYTSTDAVDWRISPELSGNVIALISTFPNYITGIIEDNNQQKFAITNTEINSWELGAVVSNNFPIDNYSSTLYQSKTGIWRNVLTGKEISSSGNTLSVTTPWYSLDGKDWIGLVTGEEYSIPYLEEPSVIYYNDKLYAFGERFESFYTSETDGLVWNKVEKKALFDEEFAGRMNYSMAVDGNNYIWLIWGKGTRTYTDEGGNSKTVTFGDEVWKGRINRTGFDIK